MICPTCNDIDEQVEDCGTCLGYGELCEDCEQNLDECSCNDNIWEDEFDDDDDEDMGNWIDQPLDDGLPFV